MDELNIINQYLTCLKSRIIIIPTFIVPAIINLLIISNLRPQFFDIISVIFSTMMIAYAVYWFNDVADLSDDLKNKELGDPYPAMRPIGSACAN